jgi:alkylated DNA repair dioxygenase AlkB
MNPIPGLEVVHEYVSEREEAFLLEKINSQEWSTILSRRVQHYGYEYNYRGGPMKKTTPTPDWLFNLCRNIRKDADQVIINEYKQGQGINPHVDHIGNFDGKVIGLCLGSGTTMIFDPCDNSIESVDVYLPARTLYTMEGDARYKWKHSIVGRKYDKDEEGNKVERGTRVSITLRKTNKK